MILFLIGLMVGGFIGVTTMCILQINRLNESNNIINTVIKNMDTPTGCAECLFNNDSICVLIDGCTYDEGNGFNCRFNCPFKSKEGNENK